jgi:kynurenine formamidase
MRVIDLSMTIKNHWRWGVKQTLRHDFERGHDFRASVLEIPAHAFTHVDTPLHVRPGASSVEKYDVFAYSGSAVIIDISFIKPNQEITAAHLQENSQHMVPDDIVIIKTCWDRHYDPNSKEYWSEAPYISDEAAIWLNAQKPRVVAFDFPQDYVIKDVARTTPVTLEESTAHKHLLYNGVLFVEYLCNLSEIKKNRVQLIVLPLKVEGLEGGPVRAVAIEE